MRVVGTVMKPRFSNRFVSVKLANTTLADANGRFYFNSFKGNVIIY